MYIPVDGYYKTAHWLNIPWATFKGFCGTAAAAHILTGYTATSQNGIKISGTMKNWSSTIQTATTSTSDQTKSCYRINGSNIEIVPAIGYWGLWDWSKSCIKVPMVSASGGVYAFHHILRLKTNPSPNTYQMNPSATSSGSTKWTNPGYSFNSVLFSHSSGVYTAKVSLKLGIDGEMHTRYGRSRHNLQYSINNGSKTNILNVAGSEDDYTGYEGHGYVTVSLTAGQNIRFFFGDAESNNTDTDFIIFARIV